MQRKKLGDMKECSLVEEIHMVQNCWNNFYLIEKAEIQLLNRMFCKNIELVIVKLFEIYPYRRYESGIFLKFQWNNIQMMKYQKRKPHNYLNVLNLAIISPSNFFRRNEIRIFKVGRSKTNWINSNLVKSQINSRIISELDKKRNVRYTKQSFRGDKAM